MANTKMFASTASSASRHGVATTAVNRAGGRAYDLSAKAALAQMAATGVFNDTYYASAGEQLDEVRGLLDRVDADFVAKLAVYAREKAHMKDVPAYLTAALAQRDVSLLPKLFDRVMDNGKMLRNFVQIVRSGQAGRRSLGSRPKKLVQRWLNHVNEERLLAASVGNAPSLADLIRLSHPKAKDGQREAFFKHVLGMKVEAEQLPALVRSLEAFRSGDSIEIPKVPFEMLAGLPLSTGNWCQVARQASWTQTRMNLNTFLRHGVFADREMVKIVADKLRDRALIAKAKAFPYQLMAAHLNVDASMPKPIVNALQDAMEIAIENVPDFGCEVAVLVDTSGSMGSPVTGHRVGSTSKVRCVDVAGLFASAVLRRNPDAAVVPFDTRVHEAKLNAHDAVLTNAKKLAAYGGGGTDCSAALKHLNAVKSTAELVIYVSDNESWVDRVHGPWRGTGVMQQWEAYKRRVRNAKLVCIDITSNTTTQAKERKDILNVGGFSDEVFRIVDLFARDQLGAEHWIEEIEKVVL